MRKRNGSIVGMAVVFAMFLGSCQTEAPVRELVLPAASSITTEVDGFSPLAEAGRKNIDFALTIGEPESVKTWRVEIKTGMTVLKTYSGVSSSAPSILTWNGKGETGVMAPAGIYTAVLNISYSTVFATFTTESTSFVLDTDPPSGRLIISPAESLISAGKFKSPVIITIDAVSNWAAVESWSLEIVDFNGIIVKRFSDKWPQNKATWDGMSSGGMQAPIPQNYKVFASVRDIYGSIGEIEGSIRVAAIPKPIALSSASAIASITPQTRGFSPNGDAVLDSMVFDLVYGRQQAVKAWKMDILRAGKSIRSFVGTSTLLPSNLSWDGRKTDTFIAEEGSYTASLAIDYGTAYAAVIVQSEPVVLALALPVGTISLSESLYSPIESHPSIGISVSAFSKVATMKNWSMRIYDPAWNLFKSFDGEWPNTSAVWDGKGISGEMVESAEDYAVVVKVRDEFGNTALLTSNIPVDILVEKTPTGYRILSSRIYFRAYTADYSTVEAVHASRNVEKLDQLAAKLKKFPDYSIRIVGHAVKIYWDDQAKGLLEQQQVLLPLSAARAEALAKAMTARGFDASKIITVGVGADDQLVADSDLVNRWRNRRVAFFLEKP